jgi:flavodoxin/ferredoxin
MRSAIVYYSQNDSTRKIARAIRDGLRAATGQCDLFTVKQAKELDLAGYDLVGLGSPIWMGAETPNLRNWIDALPKQGGRHVFAFNTHGVMPELYFPSLVRRLMFKEFTVVGTRDWFGEVKFQTAPVPYYTEGHPDAQDLEEAAGFGREMAQNSARIAAGETDLIPPVPELVWTPQLQILFEFFKTGHNPHGHMTYDRSKCLYPKCRICVENCLMEYIDFSQEPRKYGSSGDHCDMWFGCTFCESICPTGAISCDWEAQEKRNVTGGFRVGGNALHENAVKMVAEGRLRMTIPFESVDWKRLWYQVHAQRPRYKVPKKESDET